MGFSDTLQIPHPTPHTRQLSSILAKGFFIPASTASWHIDMPPLLADVKQLHRRPRGARAVEGAGEGEEDGGGDLADKKKQFLLEIADLVYPFRLIQVEPPLCLDSPPL